MRVGAVIPAAGSGQRLGGRDKALLPLAGRPALVWVLEALITAGVIEEIVVAASEASYAAIELLCQSFRSSQLIRVVRGGSERSLSVRAAVGQLSPHLDYVLIHDVARPLVTPELIRRAVAEVQQYGAILAAIPVVDTIKQVSPEGRVVATPDRSTLVAAQTPQVFRIDWLEEAYRRVGVLSVTDEATLLERAGFPVYTVPGEVENLKVTTPLDLFVAELVLAQRRRG